MRDATSTNSYWDSIMAPRALKLKPVRENAESTFTTLRAPGGPLSSAYRKRNGKRATSSFIAATPGHGLKRLKEVDEFFLIKRPI